MLIRMTAIGTSIAGLLAGGKVAIGGLLAAGVVWVGGLFGADSGSTGTVWPSALSGGSAAAVWSDGLSEERSGDEGSPPTALAIDAAAGRQGRELVDPRLDDVDAEVRLPRTPAEARTNVLYFEAQGYRVVVAGPRAASAADAVGVSAVRTGDLGAALAAAEGR
jgi:hypothetical protein